MQVVAVITHQRPAPCRRRSHAFTPRIAAVQFCRPGCTGAHAYRAGRRTNLHSSQQSARASTPDAVADTNESAKATPAVYKAVVTACLGAFLFGYHLGVVNGPLGQIAADLSFGDNVSMQGLVRRQPHTVPTCIRSPSRQESRSVRCGIGALQPAATQQHRA